MIKQFKNGAVPALAIALAAALALTLTACSTKTDSNAEAGATTQSATLAPQLDALRARHRAEAPAAILQIAEHQKDLLREAGIVTRALNVGDAAPSFALPNSEGDTITLASLLENGPVVLTFYRGAWCPYCNLQLQALQEYLPQFKSVNAQLVAVSPELPDKAVMVAKKNKLEFEVLSDVGSSLARQFGIVYELCSELDSLMANNGMDLRDRNMCSKAELPLAATYIIGADGVIRWAYLTEDYTYRAEPAEILEAMQTM
ncbi:MAG TPA: peroxiredoxin-like family protein [candidate division Zixibacteria bacterium]|nr:peroxiredoxin-like family protein [candidate division Zixibacteria bacterium]